MAAILREVSPELLRPPASALRIAMHPDGRAPRIVNFDAYSAHLMGRLRRKLAASGDAELIALRDELRQYPNVSQCRPSNPDPGEMLFAPLVVSFQRTDLTFFSNRHVRDGVGRHAGGAVDRGLLPLRPGHCGGRARRLGEGAKQGRLWT